MLREPAPQIVIAEEIGITGHDRLRFAAARV
jgi:hypothetical protein